MIREVKPFKHDFPCHKGGGPVCVRGNVIPRPAQDGDDQAHRVKITYCTGIATCGAALPKVALAGDCEVIESLFTPT